MPRKSKNKSSSSSTTSPFQREIRVPVKAIGIVIGKGGSTLKSLQRIPGISSVKCTSNGGVEIHADSQQALETVSFSIEQLISFSLDKNNGYFPDFFTFCLCKSLQDPLLVVNKVCFETFSNAISNLSGRDTGTRRSFYCLKSTDFSEDSTIEPIDDTDILSEELADTMSKVFFHPQWDFSVYKSRLLSCLEPLFSSRLETMRSIKLIIRFGKQLFYGPRWSELQQGALMSVGHLQDLCRRELLDQRFSTACSDSSVQDLGLLHLQTLGYQKMSSRKKITIHVADLQQRQLQYNISVRFEGSEGSNESIAIKRVRNQPKRHCFVIFCREGSARADFRLGVMTHGTHMDPSPDMVEWIDKAWKNRTPEGLLVFEPPGRFLFMNIRYKEADTYVSGDWKFRIAQIGDGARNNKLSKRWDCVLSSRWFKKNADKIAESDNMDLAMGNVETLVSEAARLSHWMDNRVSTSFFQT